MLIRRNEFTPMYKGFFDNFFNDDFGWKQSNFSKTETTLPAVNIKDTEDNFFVGMAAPGMDKNDFKINIENDILTISSEKKEEKTEENEKYSRREYSYQSFQRSFNIPREIVDSSKISAKYENGELTVTIPKREETKPQAPKSIEIE